MKRRALVLGLLASVQAFALHDEVVYFTEPDGFRNYKIVLVPDPGDGKPKPAYKSKSETWQINGTDPGTGDFVYQNRYTGENILVDRKTRTIKLTK